MCRASWSPSSSRVAIAAALLLLLLAAGCGYRLAGTWAQLPAGIRTVFVPAAGNTTVHPELDVPVTEAFRNRLGELGFPVVAQGDADSLLLVTVQSLTDVPLSWDQAQNVLEYRLTVSTRLVLVPAGKTEPLRTNERVAVSESYAAGATQEETNDNRAEALATIATRLAADGIERLLTGF
jgi:outer membrane lipopolysaccharide assembly protein LptE/RlpB